jgi:hypothetical protein
MTTHTYGVQWVDHGGPYHEPNWSSQVPTALRQLGFDPNKVLVEVGGVKMKVEREDNYPFFGYIKTNVALPEWDGMSRESARWVDDIILWFYTWELNEDRVEEWYELEEFDELYHS